MKNFAFGFVTGALVTILIVTGIVIFDKDMPDPGASEEMN